MSSAPTDRSLVVDGILFTICAALIGSLLTHAFAESARPEEQLSQPIGQLERRSNEVRRRADGTLVWQGLEKGGSVYGRDAVYAGQSSEAIIALDDGSRIEVDQNSLVVLQRVSTTEEEQPLIAVEVLRGGASGKVGRGRIAIKAGGAKLMLQKGGKARVRLAKDRSAKIDVEKGRAVVESTSGPVTIAEGQRGVIDATGHQATPIQRLSISLVTPGPAERRFLREPKERVVFRWEPHTGVGPYMFELSRNAEFTDLIASVKTKRPTVIQKRVGAGIHYWRVSRKLRGGQALSEDRKLALVLDTPPLPYEPRASEVVDLSRGGSIPFSWGEVPDVGQYRIEIAKGAAFHKPVAQATVGKPAYRLDQRLEEGRYCFRVRSQEAERPNAPWSQVTCFRIIVRPIFRAPKGFKPKRGVVPAEPERPKGSWLWRLFGSVAYAANPKSTAIIIRWEKIPGAPAYLLEIALDKAFKQVVIKERVTDTYYSWRTVVRRSHYWRVRVVDAEGREGEVSEAIRIDPEVSPPVLLRPSADKRFAFANSAPRVTLRWKGADVLKDYVVEISTDPSFATGATLHKTGGATQYLIKEAKVGELFWRVSGIDLLGDSTQPSESRRFVVYAAAPALTEPAAGRIFVWAQEVLGIQLSWSKRPVSSYEVQVAKDVGFGKLISGLSSSTRSLLLKPATMGDLHWRVRGASPRTAWSAPSHITVVPAQPLPEGRPGDNRQEFEGEQTTVELRWNAVPKITTYEVELAREGTNADEPVDSLRVDTTTARLELQEGLYSWTVRAVHASGASSDKSASQSFELVKREPEVVEAQPVMVEPAPKPKVKAVVEPSAAALHVAPRIGFLYNFGAIIAPRFGVEIGYLLSVRKRGVRVALSVSYLTSNSSQSSERGGPAFNSRLHAVPIELVGVFVFTTPITDLSAGAGISVDLRYRRMEISTQPTVEQTDVEFGGVIVAGAARAIGPGSLFAQLSYALATQTNRGFVENAPGGLGLALGYRIGIW